MSENSGFISITKELTHKPDWFDARPHHQTVFMAILFRCAFKEIDHNIQGNVIKILPGQLCASFRQIQDWSGKWISKNDVEGAIKYFKRVNFLRQEIRHGKMILTICDSDIYNTLIKSSQTTSQKQVRHKSDIKEQGEQGKQEKEKIKKEKIEKIAFKDNVLMTQDEYEKLVKDHGKDKIEDFIDRLSIYKHSTGKRYHSSYHTILGWIRKEKDEFKLKQIYQEDKSEYDLSDSDPFLKIHSKRGII